MSPATDFIRPLVMSGPSGVGKSTLLKRLFADYPDKFGFSVSRQSVSPPSFHPLLTARSLSRRRHDPRTARRRGRRQGLPLRDARQVQGAHRAGRLHRARAVLRQLLRHQLHDRPRGPGLRPAVSARHRGAGTSAGPVPVLPSLPSEHPSQGVRQVKATDLNPVYLFVSPPSLAELRQRLQGRGTETEAAVAKRLATALKEVEYAKEGAHDLVIVNDDLDRAYEKFKSVALGEPISSDPLPPLDD